MAKRKPKQALTVRDRVIELRRVRAGDLVPNPSNWRTHSPAQKKAMQGILQEIGYADAALARALPDGRLGLLDGHLRQSLDPEQQIPVLVLDLSEEEGEKLMLSLDPLAGMAGTQPEHLQALLERTTTQDEALQKVLDDLAAKAGLDRQDAAQSDPQPEAGRAAELAVEWGTAPGQLWQIEGRTAIHRVMCGDSTSKKDVEELLDGERPFIMVTDPPYGVKYNAKWRTEAGLQERGAHGAVTRASWAAAYALFPGAVAYVWHASLFAPLVARGLEAAGFQVRSQIIWAKRKYAISRGDYHWAHEPAWYAVRKGSKASFCRSRKEKTVWGDIIDQHNTTGHAEPLYAAKVDDDTLYAFGADRTTVWELSQDKMVEGGHSRQKPLECMARPIRNHGKKGDGVYDPFAGTGTTIIAAENTGRVGFGMEIDAAYLAVILQRAKTAGMTAELIE